MADVAKLVFNECGECLIITYINITNYLFIYSKLSYLRIVKIIIQVVRKLIHSYHTTTPLDIYCFINIAMCEWASITYVNFSVITSPGFIHRFHAKF